MVMLQGQTPKPQPVRPDFGLTGAQIKRLQRSPYDPTFAPGEANIQDVLAGLQNIWQSAGLESVPGIGPHAPETLMPGSRPRPNYFAQHRPDPSGPRAFDLLENGIAPADIYTNPQYYTGYPNAQLREVMRQLNAVRTNPDALVTVYRAAPSGAKLNKGDWVTLSREYAQSHGKHPTDPSRDMPVIAEKIPARNLRWAGDDLMEYGYFPGKK